MGRYRVDVAQDGLWWVLVFPDHPGLSGQVRRLSQAEATAKELAAAWDDIAPSDVTVELAIDLPGGTRQLLDQAAARESEGQRSLVAARELRSAAIESLAKLGLTQRDIATALGLSHQRIQQLVRS